MTTPAALRRKSAELAGALPPLLADAERLAAMVLLGEHGRRHSGMGDEFWQYRVAVDGDEARQIDWRRSARSDVHFIRQKEWQAAQSGGWGGIDAVFIQQGFDHQRRAGAGFGDGCGGVTGARRRAGWVDQQRHSAAHGAGSIVTDGAGIDGSRRQCGFWQAGHTRDAAQHAGGFCLGLHG